MPLVDLKTNLKSLKYGYDRPGGGSSDQPYIKTDINTLKNGVITIPDFLGFDDGLVRGGLIGAANASITDTFRIGKFLLDLPKGPLFIAKQVGLQLSNPRLETIKLSASQESRNILSQPTRLYNLGINTIAQIPVNAFGIHFDRHGLLPIQDEQTKYENVVGKNNESGFNRLTGLKQELGLIVNKGFRRLQQNEPLIRLEENGLNNPYLTRFNLDLNELETDPNLASFPADWVYQTIPPKRNNDSERITIGGRIPSLSYFGGPESVYGIGNTTIRRFSDTENRDAIEGALARSSQLAGKSIDENGTPIDINYANTLGVSKFYFRTVSDIQINTGIDINNPTNKPENLDLTTFNKEPLDIIKNSVTNVQASVRAYQALIESNEKTRNSSPLNNVFYPSKILDPNANIWIQGDYSIEKLKEDITYSNSYGQKVVLKTYNNWSKAAREQRIGHFGVAQTQRYEKKENGQLDYVIQEVQRADSINLTPRFIEDKYFGNDKITPGEGMPEYNIKDLVKFRIQSVNTNNPDFNSFMVFRAYLTQLSDSVDANWSDINYVGRGNPFYIYKGFNRKVNIGFKVAALSREEMAPMYVKLNDLMESLMPDYEDNLMRGPLHRMTIGNYFDAQLGIINSLNYKVSDDSPWEIALDEPEGGIGQLILPHILEITMTFIPIGAETNRKNEIEGFNPEIYKTYIAQNNTGDLVNGSSFPQYYLGGY